MSDFLRMWDQVEDDLGFNDHNMRRDRPYSGQPHTDAGHRGSQIVSGLTMRDIRDCYIRAYCLASGCISEKNMVFYNEAQKGENGVICENDIFSLDGTPDPIAVCQNMTCEIEKIMGIFPNLSTNQKEPE